jgi:hypothetical protein
VFADFPFNSSHPAVTLSSGLLAVAILVLSFQRTHVRNTTLIGPWRWLLMALFGLLLAQIAKASGMLTSPTTTAAIEFLAGVATVCPIMSVLGAKRPQDKAWHFIVLSLWIVLVLPATEVLLLRSGASLRLHPIQSLFLAVLVVVGLLNYVPTRFWVAASGYALGQVALLGPHVLRRSPPEHAFETGVALVGLATLLVSLNRPPRRRPTEGWNRAWLDFRDAFGALWGLRVMERLNGAAVRLNWPTQISWRGFVSRHSVGRVDPQAEPVMTRQAERSIRMLLRRFVSDSWLPPSK